MNLSELKIEANRLTLSERGGSLSAYQALAQKVRQVDGDIPAYVRSLKVAFLGSYTLTGLPDAFVSRGLIHNLHISCYEADYNQFSQESLSDKSPLYSFEPNLIYLFADIPEIINADHLRSVITRLIEKTDAHVVVASFIEGVDAKKAELLNTVLKEQADLHEKMHCFDLEQFLKEKEKSKVWLTKYVELGDFRIAPQAFPALAESLLSFGVSISGATRKCLVTDLDNTLWKGIVGEEGVDNVVPDVALQEYMLELTKQGIILAINSKNNEPDALAAIDSHEDMLLRRDNFAAWRINWEQKDKNIGELAKELNIGTDSLVFMDDDPFQQDLVLHRYPEVAVIHPNELVAFAGFTKSSITVEDVRRGAMYVEERKRQASKQTFTSEEDYLKSLKLKLFIGPMTKENFERVVQLTQKTNQFNMTTQRFSPESLDQFLAEGGKVYIFRVEDVFGDYGVVGAVFAKEQGEQWEIVNVLMSCRVIGRGIEDSVISYIVGVANKEGIKNVVGTYIPSAKNSIAKNLYADTGFTELRRKNGTVVWSADSSSNIEPSPYVKVFPL